MLGNFVFLIHNFICIHVSPFVFVFLLFRRIAVRKDTCRLDVITLDVKERISAFIWSKEVLPFDCVKALAVPKPIGGTLIFAVNSLFYLNQGIPPYGVSLNSVGDNTMENVVSKFGGSVLA